jgi:serine/threonine-protein kinase
MSRQNLARVRLRPITGQTTQDAPVATESDVHSTFAEEDIETLEVAATRIGGDAPTSSGTNPIVDLDGEDLVESANRYERIRRLGVGGMGEVLLCRDQHIGRAVAMKVVHSEYGGEPIRRARFLREARIQGQLEHPAIVPVYDLDRGNDGHPFFTMKRVRGQTLEEILELQRRGDRDAGLEYTRHKLLSAFTRVCLAIDFAHSRGIVHRDLKPANMMFGRFGEVYVLDWGLAKRLENDDIISDAEVHKGLLTISSGTFTAVGVVMGTPAYMAPEQIEGRADLIGPRSDIYALGAILFEILTLETLHGSDSPAAMLARALKGVEARPSRRAPDRMVPPELEEICVRATARRPEHRFVSARQLADAVEAHLAGDRDGELRRELAERHVASARAAAERALGEASEADRTLALREAGRAIALRPDDEGALRVLVDLLTTPPKAPPPEVVEEVERTRIASLGPLRLTAAISYIFVGVLLCGLSLVLHLAPTWQIAVAMLAWLFASGVSYYGAKRASPVGGSPFRIFTIAGATAVALTSLLGVLIILPAMAAVNAMGQMLTTARSNRAFVVAMNALAIVVPIGLVWGGALPYSGAPGTLPFLAIVGVTILITSSRFAARCRDELSAAHTRNALQAWQLERLVPERATTLRPKSR